MKRPLIVGLTGGIGCGKSTVCDYFSRNGIPIIDADLIAREQVQPGTLGLQRIIEVFGKEYLTEDGHLDRNKMRNLVFHSSEKKQLLETILHPLIQKRIMTQIEEAQSKNQAQPPFIIVAIPLLIEKIHEYENQNYLNEIWVIDCPETMQLARASARDQQSQEQIQKIINHQASRKERLKWATRVIRNDKDLSYLYQQLHDILNELK
ncbi:dephospho-CoA kinase [Thiomicrorhabdus sp. zzn3]|uniref:dephospho-CoA kinase n=1 Tax=Thiomicrorhabdus sp. zzn3 TaxID=3039775 RepID=UPI002436CF8E|nr:dephospho-CoA kinase [Thiomicrorhabdus sp. zzn3]MDG6778476.1 dephospho-CoA kinase [Thiomicrorhabdus sp. zzn3]